MLRSSARSRGLNGLAFRARPVLGLAVGVASLVVLIPALQLLGGRTGSVGPSLPLFFLAPVLFAALLGGRATGAFFSVLAVLAWDWFFIPPLHSVTVNSSRDLLALFIFLSVAVLTGQLVAVVRHQTADAIQRAESAEALYQLSTALIAQGTLPEVLATLTGRLRSAFSLRACAVLLSEHTGVWHTAAVAGELSASTRVESSRTAAAVAEQARRDGRPYEWAEHHAQFLPLRIGGRFIGMMQLIYQDGSSRDPDRARLLATFANGAALAIEQVRLRHEEQEAALARESDRLKTALLSSVSHDLRTPLAGIKVAASSLLQEDVEWSAEDRQVFAADIDQEADRLTRLVTNLLDLSRIEAGALHPDKEWEDLGELVQRVVHRLQPNMPGHTISIDCPKPLPAVHVDAVQIEQILVNLLENAAKYSDPDAPIAVHLAAVQQGDDVGSVRLSVEDRGPGIPRSERLRVFDKFYRLTGARANQSGTGMGLAIVKGLVRAHDGHVWVESASRQGSIFVVELPIDSDRAAPVGPAVPLADGGA